MHDHPQRFALSNEFHARPFPDVTPPVQLSHVAVLIDTKEAGAERRHIEALCDRYGAAHPPAGTNHHTVDIGTVTLRWERHTEFVGYTFMRSGAVDAPFDKPPITVVSKELIDAMPGTVIAAVHLGVNGADPEAIQAGPEPWFVQASLASSLVSGGNARVWTDFRTHEDGYGRILITDNGLKPGQAGRLVQRLIEVETYRMLAMLALPIAREVNADVTRLENDLAALTSRMSEVDDLDTEHALLDQLTRLSAAIEDVSASTAYRFSASRAYDALVKARLGKLREERVEGYRTIAGFMERRLDPAMLTCETVAARIETLSKRITRAANLLRTRVDVALEAQNRDLLKSMDQRAKLQLRLQQTVEGLSVAAITYYVVSLIGYALYAGKEKLPGLNVPIAQGLSIPVVALIVWAGVHRFRKSIMKD